MIFKSNFNTVELSQYVINNPDGSITIMNVRKEYDQSGRLVNVEKTDGMTLRYV